MDTHLVEESRPVPSSQSSATRYNIRTPQQPTPSPRAPGPLPLPALPPQPAVSIFPRDPRTGLQVWSGENGYPGDGAYLDFHKKRWPGAIATGASPAPTSISATSQPYLPQDAAARVQGHAAHFVHIVYTALEEARAKQPGGSPPILTAPFDAELFGHWWFEGPLWLEAVARTLHTYPTGVQLTTASAYLDHYPAPRPLASPKAPGEPKQQPGLAQPGDLLDLRPALPRRAPHPHPSAPAPSGSPPHSAPASSASSAASSFCSSPPTGSSSSPPRRPRLRRAPLRHPPRPVAAARRPLGPLRRPPNPHRRPAKPPRRHRATRQHLPQIDPTLWAAEDS